MKSVIIELTAGKLVRIDVGDKLPMYGDDYDRSPKVISIKEAIDDDCTCGAFDRKRHDPKIGWIVEHDKDCPEVTR